MVIKQNYCLSQQLSEFRFFSSLLHRNFVSYLESATTFSFNIFCGIGNHRKVDRSGQEVTLSASSKRLQTIPNIPLSLQVWSVLAHVILTPVKEWPLISNSVPIWPIWESDPSPLWLMEHKKGGLSGCACLQCFSIDSNTFESHARTPPSEKWSSEWSQTPWAYSLKVVMTNEIVRLVIIT